MIGFWSLTAPPRTSQGPMPTPEVVLFNKQVGELFGCGIQSMHQTEEHLPMSIIAL